MFLMFYVWITLTLCKLIRSLIFTLLNPKFMNNLAQDGLINRFIRVPQIKTCKGCLYGKTNLCKVFEVLLHLLGKKNKASRWNAHRFSCKSRQANKTVRIQNMVIRWHDVSNPKKIYNDKKDKDSLGRRVLSRRSLYTRK